MFKFFSGICLVVLLFAGCKTVSFSQFSDTKTTQSVSIGSIGLKKDFILQNEFHTTSVPTYGKPVKIAIKKVAFNKHSYGLFTKANNLQSANLIIDYVDSIKTKPKYVKLEIADKVAVLNALNDPKNTEVKKYLKHNTNANILTSASIALNTDDFKVITEADAIFLVERGYKNYVLQLLKDDNKQIIKFNQGVVFAYEGGSCCWSENKRHQIDIVDVVGKYDNCPMKTYPSAKRAEKKISTLKF